VLSLVALIILLAQAALATNPLLWNVVPGVPLNVWVDPTGNTRAVSKAIAEWNKQRLPLQMRLEKDSLDALVRIHWTQRFDTTISGNTTTVDDGRHLVRATVLLARAHSNGRMLNAEETRVLALHELGHVLGLEHSTDSTSVMWPTVRVRSISAADGARVRALYSGR
jgi:predicted Zn-dependent protease